MATFSADVGLVLPAVAFFATVAFFGGEDFVGANAGFLIGSKDEEEEVGAGLRIGAESFIQSCLLPSSLVVYAVCLLLLVGGGEGEGEGDGDGEGDGAGAGAGAQLRHLEVDCPLLHATFIVPHLTHTHTGFNCLSH